MRKKTTTRKPKANPPPKPASTDSITPIDSRALKILFDTYWTSAGWRNLSFSIEKQPRPTPLHEFEYAKHAGLMFDDEVQSHDQLIARALKAVQRVNRRAVADAFVASLVTRRLDIRSALGSFAFLQHLPRHSYSDDSEKCDICGDYGGPDEIDWYVLNFERFKWGGTRHLDLDYATFDLEQFARLKVPSPTTEEIHILKELLHAIERSPATTTSATLNKHFPSSLKSNANERNTIIEIFGFCGILGTLEYPGFLKKFVESSEQFFPRRRFADMSYPASFWSKMDGMSSEAIEYWFGHLLKTP